MKRASKAPFAIGDAVTCGYYPGERLTVLRVWRALPGQCQSGWLVVAARAACKHCGRESAVHRELDSDWFERAEAAGRDLAQHERTIEGVRAALSSAGYCGDGGPLGDLTTRALEAAASAVEPPPIDREALGRELHAASLTAALSANAKTSAAAWDELPSNHQEVHRVSAAHVAGLRDREWEKMLKGEG